MPFRRLCSAEVILRSNRPFLPFMLVTALQECLADSKNSQESQNDVMFHDTIRLHGAVHILAKNKPSIVVLFHPDPAHPIRHIRCDH